MKLKRNGLISEVKNCSQIQMRGEKAGGVKTFVQSSELDWQNQSLYWKDDILDCARSWAFRHRPPSQWFHLVHLLLESEGRLLLLNSYNLQ